MLEAQGSPRGLFYQDSASRANLGANLPAAPNPPATRPKVRRCAQPGARGALYHVSAGCAPHLAVLAHSSNEERVFQGDIEAPTRDANVWKAEKVE